MKGYVYFFRQVDSPYVKIGFTNGESVVGRFASFKTYAPIGATIEAVIESANAKKLESELHQKYSHNRVSGEFFQMTKEEVEAVRCKHEGADVRNLRNAIEAFISNASLVEMSKLKNALARGSFYNDDETVQKNHKLVVNALNGRFVGARFTATEVQGFLMDTIDEIEDLPSLREIGAVLKIYCQNKSYRTGDEVKKMYSLQEKIPE
jgi:hypothetical protein